MAFDSHLLAPLQQIMLRDSLVGGQNGAHVEQLEIVFKVFFSASEVAEAWSSIVTQAEIMRMAFVLDDPLPSRWQTAVHTVALTCIDKAPEDFEDWLKNDRSASLFHLSTPPWRAVYWPSKRRFLWSFHHALLDGRSITAITHYFLQCLIGNLTPPAFAITSWLPPDKVMRQRAKEYFQKTFSKLAPEAPALPPSSPSKLIQTFGPAVVTSLQSYAAELEVTSATLLLWTWGQAIARVAGMEHAIVEQVRCGPPQPGCLGFSMNTLPLLIPRCRGGAMPQTAIKLLGQQLHKLREIEAISPLEQPTSVRELTSSAWSSVVMIETSTLENLAASLPAVRSIKLHECQGLSLTACARITDQLRLEVEGNTSADLLKMWNQCINQLTLLKP